MLEVGNILDGKYRIVRLIGAGGMGEVYEGENTRIVRRVAIKVLHPSAAENKDAVERFEREAQAAGRIGNDHVLEVLDLGMLPSGEHFIVMEYLDGETLGQRIEQFGRLTAFQLTPIVQQALLGLKAAHQAGIIHRDLKPDNIFVCREKAGQADFVKIIDFGISKFNQLGGDMHMTRTGAVMGTPYYMSPEQARGSRDVDLRSDLYSMGVILYEALSGNKPFVAETFNALIFQIALAEPVPLRQIVPDLDPAFESIVYKAMSRDVAHRFQSAGDFIAALEQWSQSGQPVTIPPEIGHAPPAVAVPPAGPVPTANTPPVAALSAATADAWANTGPQSPPPAKRRTGLLAAGALGGLVLVAGAGIAGLHFMRSPAEKAPAEAPGVSAPSAAAATAAPPAESAADQPAPPPAESKPAPAASSAQAKTPPPKAAVRRQPTRTKTVEHASKPTSQPPAPKPTPPPAPKPTQPPAPKPTQPSKPAGPDFGY